MAGMIRSGYPLEPCSTSSSVAPFLAKRTAFVTGTAFIVSMSLAGLNPGA